MNFFPFSLCSGPCSLVTVPSIHLVRSNWLKNSTVAPFRRWARRLFSFSLNAAAFFAFASILSLFSFSWAAFFSAAFFRLAKSRFSFSSSKWTSFWCRKSEAALHNQNGLFFFLQTSQYLPSAHLLFPTVGQPDGSTPNMKLNLLWGSSMCENSTKGLAVTTNGAAPRGPGVRKVLFYRATKLKF